MCYNAVVFFLPHPASSCGCGTRSSPSSSNIQLPSIFISFFLFSPSDQTKIKWEEYLFFFGDACCAQHFKSVQKLPPPHSFFFCFFAPDAGVIAFPSRNRCEAGKKKKSFVFAFSSESRGFFFFLINSIIQTEACVSHITKRDQGKKKKKNLISSDGLFLFRCEAVSKV